MLERFARETKSDKGLKNEIREQITERASVIEGAEAARDASEFDRLKSRLVQRPGIKSGSTLMNPQCGLERPCPVRANA